MAKLLEGVYKVRLLSDFLILLYCKKKKYLVQKPYSSRNVLKDLCPRFLEQKPLLEKHLTKRGYSIENPSAFPAGYIMPTIFAKVNLQERGRL